MATDKLKVLLAGLKQLKDELTLQASLGQAEAEDQLAKLEPRYNDLKAKVGKIADVSGDTASELKAAAELGIHAESKEDVHATLELAAEELKNAYDKIKNIAT